MRVLDEERDMACSRLTLFLTRDEATQLRDTLEVLLTGHHQHEHVTSDDFQKEITVCLYDPSNLDSLDERARRLIRSDT
jgi:hypothetical protein